MTSKMIRIGDLMASFLYPSKWVKNRESKVIITPLVENQEDCRASAAETEPAADIPPQKSRTTCGRPPAETPPGSRISCLTSAIVPISHSWSWEGSATSGDLCPTRKSCWSVTIAASRAAMDFLLLMSKNLVEFGSMVMPLKAMTGMILICSPILIPSFLVSYAVSSGLI